MEESPYAPPKAPLIVPAEPSFARDRISGTLAPHVRVGLLALAWTLFACWFIYDGWFNPELAEYQLFNRGGSVAVAAIAAGIWFLAARVRATLEAGRASPVLALVFQSPDGKILRAATVPWLWSLTFGGLNLIPHKLAGLGTVIWLVSNLTFGIAMVPLAIFAPRLIRSGYTRAGWRELGS